MRPRHGLLAVALALATSAQAGDGIYRWTDSRGGAHFTERLSDVPPAQRHDALEQARSSRPSRLQTYGDAPEPLRPAVEATQAPVAPRARAGAGSSNEYRIPFTRHGTLMMVQVRLNDQLEVPFLVDTGASGVSIPDAVARRLGLHVGADTPRIQVQTAGGVVSEPLVELDSLEIGPARVEGLAALVNSSMEIGLLGGSFFNNFVYQVDAAQSVITLRRNDAVRGGLAEAQWRERFDTAQAAYDRLARYVADRVEGDERLPELEANLRELLEAIEALHRDANAAGVPQSWRE